ncbi:hypothetical protein ACF0H5_007499 [Mactra antiquata]
MEVLERSDINKQMESVKNDTTQQYFLRCFLKYEIQTLVQRLAEIGEESVVVTANVIDGSQTVLASQHGEQFLQDKVVRHFMEHFIKYLYKDSNILDSSYNSTDECCVKTEDDLSGKVKEQPETFMHMKKHQIEQYNRDIDPGDRAIEDEVSKLVKNILKEGKEKEKLRCNPPLPFRRKRRLSSINRTDMLGVGGSGAQKSVAEMFPTLAPMLSRTSSSSDFNSSTHLGESGIKRERHEQEVVVIKSEPDDDGEYGGINNSITDNGETNETSMEIGRPSSSTQNSECSATDNICDQDSAWNVTGGTSQGCQTSEKSDGSDEDIDLPFVEPYYQDREQCVQNVKLTPEEIGANIKQETAISAVTCFKQSRKKSNIFNLVMNGYSYIRDKQGSGGTIYWKCGRAGCKGRVIQREQELIISQRHSHYPTVQQ